MDQDSDSDPPSELFDSKLRRMLQAAEARLTKPVAAPPAPDRHTQELAFNIPRLTNTLAANNEKTQVTAKKAASAEDDHDVAQPRKVELSAKERKLAQKKRKAASAGPEWFNLPRTQQDPKTKRDLQLLQMRDVLDPHRHYRKMDRRGKLPQYSQVGTVVEGPTEFFSARLKKKDRTDSLAADMLSSENTMSRFKGKYLDIQAKNDSGRKSHYKALKAKRARRR